MATMQKILLATLTMFSISSVMADSVKGMSMEDAWDAAVKGEAGKRGAGYIKTLSKTNSFGSAFNNATIACSD